MINLIKQLAGRVSEDYLLKKKDMNDSIYLLAVEKKLNEEIIKRICEFANQNTYLSIFHADKDKRGNIQFDLADFKKIIEKIKETNMADHDYLKRPDDFRLSDEYGQDAGEEQDEVVAEPSKSLDDHLKDLKKDFKLKDRLATLLSAIKTMTTQEEMNAEDNVMKISSYCKSLNFNGESFGDMAKLALRYTKEKGYELNKTASLYSKIGEYLSDKGFKVNTELTKISSLKINHSSDTFKPLDSYHQSLIKLSGLREISHNVEATLKTLKA